MRDVKAERDGARPTPRAPADGRIVPRLRSRRWWELVLDAIAVVGIVAVVALPIASAAAGPHPTSPAEAPDSRLPLPDGPSGRSLRILPAFTPGAAARAVAAGAPLARAGAMRSALHRQFRSAFGADAAPAVEALATSKYLFLPTIAESGLGQFSYPYRYARLTPLLDAAFGTQPPTRSRADALNDLAGLLVLAAADYPTQYPNAARAAYVLYDIARRTDACVPQLNLANLLSTDIAPPTGAVASEFQRAIDDCPGDPTPLWLLGEYESLRGDASPPAFGRLEQRYPRSALGWSGEADALVRYGYRVEVGEPFTARNAFRRALGLYRLGERLDGEPGLAAGEARADAGLGDAADAVRAQERAGAGSRPPPPFALRLIDYLERDHRFAEAARVNAATLHDGSARPAPGVVAAAVDAGDEVSLEGALGPISVGTGQLQAVRLTVGTEPLVLTGGAEDISFIPLFRAVNGVTGDAGECRAETLARDLVLAGRPAAALTAMAETVATGDASCEPLLLRPIALFERGDLRAAERAVPSVAVPLALAHDANPQLATVLDADQNMWRYAGNLDKAAAAAARWSASEPDDPLGPDRAGEIAYLDRNFGAAASDFSEAASRASGEAVATEQVKQGTALDESGDPAAALPVLTAADRLATVWARPARPNVSGNPQALLDSYNARLQAGDAARRRRELAAAADDYRAARAREPELAKSEQRGVFTVRQEELFRPEVLENNQALVLLDLGRDEDALHAIDRAVDFDPADPVFLANRAFIEEESGNETGAAADYRAALASDPRSFQAANNLGVILAGEHHLGAAADAFRQAFGASPDDASAAFNLGLVLDRMGPTHMVEAEGAFAAAIRLEPELREHDHTLIVDDETYFSTLDLSKPIPPTWHFASTAKRAPLGIGGALLLLFLFRLAKGALQERVSDKAAERALETSTRRVSRRLAGIGASAPGVLALAAVVAVLVYPLARSKGTTGDDVVLLAVGIAIVTLAFMRLRRALSLRGGVVARHYPWVPAVLVGGAAALVGIGFAPMPATKGAGDVPNQARWLGTGLLGALALALLTIGRLTGVPFATGLGAICLLMTASALVPIEPYDGAFVTKRRVELAIVITLAAIGILVEAGVL